MRLTNALVLLVQLVLLALVVVVVLLLLLVLLVVLVVVLLVMVPQSKHSNLHPGITRLFLRQDSRLIDAVCLLSSQCDIAATG